MIIAGITEEISYKENDHQMGMGVKGEIEELQII